MARRAWLRQCGVSEGGRPIGHGGAASACSIRHRGNLGGYAGCATSASWWRGRRRPAHFSRLRRHVGKAGVGRARHTSFSKFGDSDSEGVLRCYLLPGTGGPIGGLTEEGYHSEYRSPLLCMGRGAMAKALPILWVSDGDVFGRRLLPWKRQPKGPLPLRGVFFLGV
jgi:hypothetical protein